MKLFLPLAEATSVFLVAFYLYARSPAFRPLKTDWLQARGKISLYFFFSGIAILGNYLGARLAGGVIANNRAVGAVLAGIIGGPLLGTAVGVTAALHRLSFGGFTALSGALATTMEGFASGLVHLYFVKRGTPERLINWKLVFVTTLLGEIAHMGMVLLLARPYPDAVEAVKSIGPPMMIANPVGAALFMIVILDRQKVYDKVGAASSAKALKIAERTLGLLARGFSREMATEMATIIHEETGVGAVAITDTEKVLAWVGAGSDHHVAGGPIALPRTRRAIAENEVIFADGVRDHFVCPLSASCPNDSVLVVPLQIDGTVIGTVQLFELEHKLFRNINRSLGEGITGLLSNQLLLTRYHEQKSLLIMAELKLIQAQVNPHFLFNSLNTIIAITRKDPDRARELLIHLSNFFRKNLKRSHELSTLAEELEHVGSYLEIEKARFEDRLVVETDIDPALLGLEVPTFTLQPLIENAIKHGLSATLGRRTARIRARPVAGAVLIEVEDDAGTYTETGRGGLGLQIVDKRIKNLAGEDFGVSVSCVPDRMTRVSIRIPAEGCRA